jgi:PAS domain-containing protein
VAHWLNIVGLILGCLAALCSLIASVYAGWRWGWPILLVIGAWFHAASLLPKILESNQRLELHFTTNGGSSVLDRQLRNEEAICWIKEMLQVILLDRPRGHFRTNAEGRWIEVGGNTCRLLNKTEAQLLGDNWWFLMDRNQQDDFWTHYARAAASRSIFSMKVRFDSGEVFLLAVNPVMDDRRPGVFLGFLGSLTQATPEPVAVAAKRELHHDTKQLFTAQN